MQNQSVPSGTAVTLDNMQAISWENQIGISDRNEK